MFPLVRMDGSRQQQFLTNFAEVLEPGLCRLLLGVREGSCCEGTWPKAETKERFALGREVRTCFGAGSTRIRLFFCLRGFLRFFLSNFVTPVAVALVNPIDALIMAVLRIFPALRICAVGAVS